MLATQQTAYKVTSEARTSAVRSVIRIYAKSGVPLLCLDPSPQALAMRVSDCQAPQRPLVARRTIRRMTHCSRPVANRRDGVRSAKHHYAGAHLRHYRALNKNKVRSVNGA
jgi:hypothetical protein